MGKKYRPVLTEPPAARAFVVAAFDEHLYFEAAQRDIEKAFGPIDYRTDQIYYPIPLREGVGEKSFRSSVILSFSRPVGGEELVDLTLRALEIETRHQSQGRPHMQLEVGYLTRYIAVRTDLAEDFHRIYLYSGIYAENIYFFQKNSFRYRESAPLYYQRKEAVTAFNDLHLILSRGS